VLFLAKYKKGAGIWVFEAIYELSQRLPIPQHPIPNTQHPAPNLCHLMPKCHIADVVRYLIKKEREIFI
jgi:hypothetical protein